MTWDVDAVLKVLGAFGTGAVGLTVMWSNVRKRIARDNAEADQSRGESNWIKRQQDELAEKEASNKLLLAALHDRDEIIAGLRLKEALYSERDKRRTSYVRRLEAALIDERPDLGDWMHSDNGPLGPPEV